MPFLTWGALCSPPGWAGRMFWPPLCPGRPHGRTGSFYCRRRRLVWLSRGPGRGLCLSLSSACSAPWRCTRARRTPSPTRPSLFLSGWPYRVVSCLTKWAHKREQSSTEDTSTASVLFLSLQRSRTGLITCRIFSHWPADRTKISSHWPKCLKSQFFACPFLPFPTVGCNQTGIFCRPTHSQSQRPLSWRPASSAFKPSCDWPPEISVTWERQGRHVASWRAKLVHGLKSLNSRICQGEACCRSCLMSCCRLIFSLSRQQAMAQHSSRVTRPVCKKTKKQGYRYVYVAGCSKFQTSVQCFVLTTTHDKQPPQSYLTDLHQELKGDSDLCQVTVQTASPLF